MGYLKKLLWERKSEKFFETELTHLFIITFVYYFSNKDVFCKQSWFKYIVGYSLFFNGSKNMWNQFLVSKKKCFYSWNAIKNIFSKKTKAITFDFFKKVQFNTNFFEIEFWGGNRCCTPLKTCGINFSLNFT